MTSKIPLRFINKPFLKEQTPEVAHDLVIQGFIFGVDFYTDMITVDSDGDIKDNSFIGSYIPIDIFRAIFFKDKETMVLARLKCSC